VLKVAEVYEKQVKIMKERPDGSDYINFEKVYDTRECLLNRAYVVSVYPHEFSSDRDHARVEDRFPEGTKFSTFILGGNSFRTSEIIVMGSFEKFCGLLEGQTR